MAERTSYAKVAIVGTTGTGKSYLTKTADRNVTGFINMERKPLPYKLEPFKFEGKPKTWSGFIKCLKDFIENKEIKNIIIDSQSEAFKVLKQEMSKNFSGFDIWNNYAKQVYEYIDIFKNAEKDIIIFSHDELVTVEGYKQKRMLSYGKEFGDGKLEREFTIVLYTGTKLINGKPTYFLKTFEEDTSSKTPEGMFPDKDGNTLLNINNDAKFIFDNLESYYS
jgi:hypothetical protein